MKNTKLATIGMICLLVLAGCGGRTIRLDLVPAEERLKPETIEYADAGFFTSDKVAMITVSGPHRQR